MIVPAKMCTKNMQRSWEWNPTSKSMKRMVSNQCPSRRKLISAVITLSIRKPKIIMQVWMIQMKERKIAETSTAKTKCTRTTAVKSESAKTPTPQKKKIASVRNI